MYKKSDYDTLYDDVRYSIDSATLNIVEDKIAMEIVVNSSVKYTDSLSRDLLIYYVVREGNTEVENENNRTIKFMGNGQTKLQYKQSFELYESVDELYFDDKKNQYTFINDNLVEYYKNRKNRKKDPYKNVSIPQDATKELDKKRAEKVRDILKEVVIDKNEIDNYVLTEKDYNKEYNGYNEYVYTYMKKINGYKVNDCITISVDTLGELFHYKGERQGIFDEFRNIKIDKKAIYEYVEKEIATREYDFDFISYEIEELTLDAYDGRPLVNCGISLEVEDGDPTYTSVWYYLK